MLGRVLRRILDITGVLICLSPLSAAQGLPVGAEIHVRLTTKVGSSSKPDDKIAAVVIAPAAAADGHVLLPAGSTLAGTVKGAAPPVAPDKRATLKLEFTEVAIPGAGKMPLGARLVEVDNAREKVDNDGQINGILDSETPTAQLDAELEKLASKWAKFAEVLQTAKDAVLQKAQADITYDPGVEMKLVLTKPLTPKGKVEYHQPRGIEPASGLYALVNALPFQTTAEKPPKPSDLTNLMFIGTREQLAKAFAEAGWAAADALNAMSGLETIRAVAEKRGFKEAPMSVLLLDGQKPDVVFQKQNNTFARRHHLRIFKRPESFQGKEVWVCAATHDTGISFSAENRTFIHRIESQIDRERAKVVFDLMFTGRVLGLALVERPKVPTTAGNATGDKIETDGKMAVLLLGGTPPAAKGAL